jgi:protein involved in ribonucleotide reduction
VDVHPLQMEFDWKMFDRLDENIDRAIKRLQVKTNKQLFPNLRKDARLSSNFIDVSPTNDNGSAAVIEKEQAKEFPATVEKIRNRPRMTNPSH